MENQKRIQEIKEVIKEWMNEYGHISAPTQWELEEVLEEYDISGREFLEAVEQIGEELEEEGYTLLWQPCEEYDAGCQRFIVIDE